MVHAYLFEAKSIQFYLFKSGKLKDVISASERLDSLIDDNKSSLLYKVIEQCNLSSDLLNSEAEEPVLHLRFLRAKGGAFYVYSAQKEALITLRSSWTLTLSQLFPSLDFTDALVEGDSLLLAIKNGHEQLAFSRNTPHMKFPLATTIMATARRTGEPGIPLSKAAKYSISDSQKQEHLDIDIEHHRQAYVNLHMDKGAALQNKFTPESLVKTVSYPTNLDDGFEFSAEQFELASKEQKEAIKDIALIHIDGNGLGIILRELQVQLKTASEEEYRKSFRGFSNALARATQRAAQHATNWLYNVAKYQHEGKTCLPMRPIVIGGDDVTLLCRADLAIEYSKLFCTEFKSASKQELRFLFKKQLKSSDSDLKNYLTASGGILFHKASHPFTHSHHLVEGLCAKAKKLTKKVDEKIGPAALAFFRLSNAVSADIEALIKQSQHFSVPYPKENLPIELGRNCYLVEQDGSDKGRLEASFDDLDKCVKNSDKMMSRWRQMATHIALGDKYEADLIYRRGAGLNTLTSLESALQGIANNSTLQQWHWVEYKDPNQGLKENNATLKTIISDMLTVNHFSPVVFTEESSKEAQ
jgi:hypothetical protein